MIVPRASLFGIRLQFQNVGLQQKHFEEMRDPLVSLGGNRGKNRVASPVFGDETVFGKPALDPLLIGVGSVDLVDGDDNRHFGSARMVDRFHRLRHHAVIRRDDKDDYVRDLRAAGAHRRESLVARCVEERDAAAVHLNW